NQSTEAKNENFDGTKDLLEVLNEFVAFILHNRTGRVKVWGNGKEFDCTIMHHALLQAGLDCP
ncbi:3'-5' exoribonuclease domain-containing protein, partial [Escherichia coli]